MEKNILIKVGSLVQIDNDVVVVLNVVEYSIRPFVKLKAIDIETSKISTYFIAVWDVNVLVAA